MASSRCTPCVLGRQISASSAVVLTAVGVSPAAGCAITGAATPSMAAMAADGFEATAMFCGSDGVAITVVSELLRMGLRVPEDVSVVGHADYPVATQVSPNLSTIHMPHREMGVAAVRQLISRSRLASPLNDLPPQRISLVPHLVERQSTGPAPSVSWRQRLR